LKFFKRLAIKTTEQSNNQTIKQSNNQPWGFAPSEAALPFEVGRIIEPKQKRSTTISALFEKNFRDGQTSSNTNRKHPAKFSQ
jgi:hypothetical protein